MQNQAQKLSKPIPKTAAPKREKLIKSNISLNTLQLYATLVLNAGKDLKETIAGHPYFGHSEGEDKTIKGKC